MKLSISNIAWGKEHDNEIYTYLKEKQIQGLEIAPTRIFPLLPYDHIKEAIGFSQDLYKQYGLTISSMQSIWYGRSENLFTSQKDIDALTIYTKKAIDFAEAIGCKNLVFGCPKNRNITTSENRLMMPNVISFFETVGSYAYKHNTIFAIEPNPTIYNTNYINSTPEAFELVNTLNNPGLKINLDLGTVIQNGEDITNYDLSKVNHIHISEPGLKKIQIRNIHPLLFQLAKKCKYDGFISIEMGCQESCDIIKETIEYVLQLNKCEG